MVGKVSVVVLGGLLVAAAVTAPDALARRGGGPGGYGDCRQQSDCGCDQDQDRVRSRRRLRDGSCRQDPGQCPNRADCPGAGPGAGKPDGAGKGAAGP